MNRDRGVLLALIGLFALASALLILPFLQYVLVAVVLAYVLSPVQRRTAPRVGSVVSASLLIALTTVAFLLPLAVLVGVLFQQAADIAAAIQTGQLGVERVQSLAQQVFGIALELEQFYPGDLPDLSDAMLPSGEDGVGPFVGTAVRVFGGLTDVFLGVTILTFVLYYLLKDGDRLLVWLRAVSPLSPDIEDELIAEIDRIMWAVVVGNVAVAIVQGVLMGIGLAGVGFSNVIFWTVMTMILSLLPIVGAPLIWVPGGAYLVVSGRPVAAVALVVYGAFVVGLSDNYLRPLIVDRSARLNPSIIVVGIFGGITLLGFMGIFFGPIILGVLKTLLELFARKYD
ncbi:MAG: AI-2E family transporter [Halobacteriota archaeon]